MIIQEEPQLCYYLLLMEEIFGTNKQPYHLIPSGHSDSYGVLCIRSSAAWVRDPLASLGRHKRTSVASSHGNPSARLAPLLM